jgi:hypothetical protein
VIQADQVPLAPSIGGQITSEVVDSGGDLDYKKKLYRDELLFLTESLALPDSPLIGPPNGPSLTPPKGPSADGPPHGRQRANQQMAHHLDCQVARHQMA